MYILCLLLEQPIAAWSSRKGTLSSKTSIYPNYSCSSGHGHHITESHPLSSNSSTSSLSDDGVIQHPSPKVSTHVHGLGYGLIHPLCVTAIMMHNTVCLVIFMGCYMYMYLFLWFSCPYSTVHVHTLIIRATCCTKC